MRNVRWRKSSVFIILIGLTLIIIPLYFFVFNPSEIPVTEINNARLALSEAGKTGAEKYASNHYQLAYAFWDSLMTEWKIQNETFLLKRDFSQLGALAGMVSLHANRASECAKSSRSDIQTAIEIDLGIAGELITIFDKNYLRLPIPPEIYDRMIRSKMLYSESIRAYERKEYHRASELLSECRNLAESSEKHINEFLTNYFSSFSNWEKWVKETIQWSRKNRAVAIVVDKFSHTCFVYNKGLLVSEYVAEFGTNWIGDKNYSGDKTTPEGKYFVTKKLSGRQTKYHKALLINYPNEDDKKRYSIALKDGLIPKGRGIGNLIEIHGGGGNNVNWTDGCVALDNKDMDQVFKLAGIGSPVTIVGSLKPLEEIMNKE